MDLNNLKDLIRICHNLVAIVDICVYDGVLNVGLEFNVDFGIGVEVYVSIYVWICWCKI